MVTWKKLRKKLIELRWAQKINETELSILLKNGSTISLKGADNYDSLRGIGLDYLVIDEFADIDPEAWYETLRPTLSDKQGGALFIGTPKGLNWAKDLYDMYESDSDEWVSFHLDGRRISMILEMRISKLKGFQKAPSESSPFDVIDPQSKKAEVRCLTEKIMFRPSDQIGMGRKFDETKFYNNKILQVDYFMIADINEADLRAGFVNIFNISSSVVWELYKEKKIGKNAEKSRNTFLKMMKEMKIYG